MAEGALISAVLPSFNHARYIATALRAIAGQTVPHEIIVVEDASTDDSLSVIRRAAAGTPYLKVLINPVNRGVIATLQRGIDAATAPYIYLGAADDWVLPGFFALAVRMLEAHPRAGLFCGDVILTGANGSRVVGMRPAVRPRLSAGEIDPQAVRRLLRRSDNWIHTGSALFRREAIAAAGALDASLGSFADGYLVRRTALARGFCYAPRPVAVWRLLGDSQSRHTAADPVQALRVLDHASARLANDPVFPPWYAAMFGRRWRFAVCRLALQANPVNRGVLEALGGPTAPDRAILKALRILLARLPSLERTVTLTWLAVRLRPYALLDLAVSSAQRRWRGAAREASAALADSNAGSSEPNSAQT
jgi:glycosyltransferase involved in cell wall biosynthesis